MTFFPHRRRLIYALALILVIACGLFFRSHWFPLSHFFAKYGGDALWALMVFLGLGFLFTQFSILRLAPLSLAFAWAIEFSQLYHAPWIDTIRSTLLGNLALGSTFNDPDLIAYALGIGLGLLLEKRFFPFLFETGISEKQIHSS